MPRLAVPWFAIAIACASCAKDTGGSPFDVQGAPPTNLTAADDPNGDPEDDEDEDDEDEDESSSEGGDAEDSSSSSDAVDEPPATTDPDSSGTTTGGEPDSDGDADAGEQPGGQPAEGMYSTCAMPSDCVGVNLCVTILDPMQMPLGGFCTSPGCANAAVDCVAAPGGTATPMCLPLTVNDMPDAACALDCGGGKTCPAGMECIDVTGASICV